MSTRTPGTQTPTLPPAPPDALARQLRQFKALALVLLIALVGGGGTFLYLRHLGQPVAILLDGAQITSVRNAASAEQLLTQAEQAKIGGGFPESAIVRLQKVQMQVLPSGGRLDPERVAKAKLENALRLNVHAYAILVDGHVSLGLPSDAVATDTLHAVKEHFTQMPPDAEIVGEPSFTQRVTIAPRAVSAALARSTADAAAAYFWTPPPSRAYVVRRGDTGLAIARRNHVSFTDFIVANAGHDIDRLTPGTTVNVQKMPLLLSVRVQKRFTRSEKVMANVPASEAGLQRVTYLVTYINGQETHRDPVGIVTITAPEPRAEL